MINATNRGQNWLDLAEHKTRLKWNDARVKQSKLHQSITGMLNPWPED